MQDSKNLILAIVLCLVILFGWGRLAEYMGWVQTPDPAAVAQQQEAVRQEAVKAEQHIPFGHHTALLEIAALDDAIHPRPHIGNLRRRDPPRQL